MKVLKKVIYAVLIVIAIVLLVAAIAPKKYDVEREIAINKATPEVFNYVKFLKNQDNFSVWATIDPNMKKDFQGTDGTIGAVSFWESENKDVGKGEQEITGVTQGSRIDFEIRFIEPFESTDLAYFVTSPRGEGTLVKWGFNGKMPYPMNLMLLFLNMDNMLGPDLEKGLLNLKEILEQQ